MSLVDLHPQLLQQGLFGGRHASCPVFVESFNDGDEVECFVELVLYFVGFPVFEVLYANEKDVVKSVADILGPVIV